MKFYVASASGWTGVPEPNEALILHGAPAQNDGTTPHTQTVHDVPVDGFWSVTVYNRDLAVVKNQYDAQIVNSVTAKPNEDGSVTIHFGGNPEQPNFIYTPEGWRYLVRLYGTRQPIIDGSFQFPTPNRSSRARGYQTAHPRTAPCGCASTGRPRSVDSSGDWSFAGGG